MQLHTKKKLCSSLLFTCILTIILPSCSHKNTKKRKKKKIAKVQPQEKKSKLLSDLNYEDLKKEKNKLLAKGNKEIAIKYIKRMLPLCSNLEELGALMLETADLLFDAGKLNDAERMFAEFVHLYPGDKNVEYASYKSILCSYWTTLDAERDQSKTKETVEKAITFLDRKLACKKYNDEVTKILLSCRQTLFDSQVNVFNFYAKQGNYLAAQTRLAEIKKEFSEILPTAEPKILLLACDLAEKQNNKTLLQEKKLELATKFPNFIEQTKIAQQNKKNNKANRF